MLAPDLERMVAHAAGRGVRCGLNTNGTLLTRERAERLIDAGLDWLHVSLDGATAETYEFVRDGSDFERVRRNVAGLVAARRERGSERPRLSLVFVAMRRNVEELPDVVRIAHEWEVERLFVQNLSHTFSDTDPAGGYAEIRRFAAEEALFLDPERAEGAFARARALADELGVDLRLPRLSEPERPQREPGEPGCHWPFEAAYVTHKGHVQPCCMVMGDDRATLGDASAEGFAPVWNGPAYREFRAALLTDSPPEVCAGCSLYHGLF
jgi:radical SAM protein with 4Fe4S-binding SPASM domain